MAICKILSDLPSDVTTVVTFVGSMSAWAYTRLYFLSVFIKIVIFDEKYNVNLMPNAINFMGSMLMFIWILNLYWFLLFCQMLTAALLKGKVEDT